MKVPYTLDGPYFCGWRAVWHDLVMSLRAALRTWKACRLLRAGANPDYVDF